MQNLNYDHFPSGKRGKLQLLGKTAIIGLLCMCGLIPATQALSQQAKMDLSYNQRALTAVLEDLKSKSGHQFVYFEGDIPQSASVTYSRSGVTLDEALSEILSRHNLSHRINDGVVVIRTAEATPQQQRPAERNISGTVKDSQGRPVLGASVVVKGTTIGTSTDVNGNFQLRVPGNANEIEISFVGYERQSVTVGDRRNFEITLVELVAEMGDVIVTGYYTQSQTAYTGSAKSYTGEQLLSAGNNNVLKSLSNLDPAFRMTENISAGSNPNVLPDFTIRGQTAINFQEEYQTNPNQPLFILDGFEVDAETVFDMDVYRVQSVTLLKDASATAIYGSRASNGVVVITTFAPKDGKLTVRYNMDLTFEAADLSDYNLMNAQEKFDLEVSAGMYSYFDENRAYSWEYYLESRDRVYAMLAKRQGYMMQGIDTYWLDKPLHSMTVGHRHRVNIEGGEGAFRYQVNAMYENRPGVMKESYRDRQNIGTKFVYNYRNFRFSNDMSYNITKAQNSPYGSFSEYALLNPYLRPKDDNGNYIARLEEDTRGGGTLSIYNPLYNSTLNTRDDTRANYFTNNFNVVWDVNDDLMITGTIAVRDYDSEYNLFKPAAHTKFGNYSSDNFDRKGEYRKTTERSFMYDGSIVAAYQKSFNLHTLTARAGYNIREQKNESYTVEAEGFPNENLDDIGFALQYIKDGSPSSTSYKSRLLGLLANVNYIYNERYMADFSFRYDAQSSFGADRKWAPLWSAGLGWNIHKEDFIRNKQLVNQLKLRGSVGETGSVDYDPAQAIATYQYLHGTRYLSSQGAMMKTLGNPELGWQKTFSYNAGIDVTLFRNKLNFTFDYYNKTTNDMITSITIASSTGYSRYMANLGKVENRGFEFYVRAEAFKSKDLTIWVFGQVMKNKNTLKKISNALRAYNDEINDGMDSSAVADADGVRYNRPRVNYIEGRSVNGIWVNQSLGVDPATGKEFFVNLADGSYTDTWRSLNNIYGGCTDPKLFGTFGFSVYWKTLMVTANFGYSYGADYYNQTLIDKVEDADLRYNVDRRVASDRWQKPGDISKFTAIGTTQYQGPANTGRATRPTSRFIEKRSYLELQSVTASYDIRGPKIQASAISNLRINFNMDDLFHASTVKTERGISYPYSRSFSLGVQVTF